MGNPVNFFTHVYSHEGISLYFGVRKHGCKSNMDLFPTKAAKLDFEEISV